MKGRVNLISSRLAISVLVVALLGCTCYVAGAESFKNDNPVIVTDQLKAVILSMTACAENSQTTLNYGYAENIGDGRGITFGIIGFTTGTYDGTKLLESFEAILPGNSFCAKYLPEFRKIDASNDDGKTDYQADIDQQQFIKDFAVFGVSTAGKQAQIEMLDQLYWKPALAEYRNVGGTRGVTLQAIYDAYVNHGESGVEDIVTCTNKKVKPPNNGGNEMIWLNEFLAQRRAYDRRRLGGHCKSPGHDKIADSC